MRETTLELMKKTEDDSELFISATESLTCRTVYARIPRSPAEETCRLHRGTKNMNRPDGDGNVLILRDPSISDSCSVESPGPMETIDVFMKKAVRIPVDRNAAEKGTEEGYGTSCC